MLPAIATIFFEKSTPVGFAPTFLTAADTYPGPHATSNTDVPAETSAAPSKYGINWRVSDDQTASHFSATRCQPSYSNRVNSSPFEKERTPEIGNRVCVGLALF